MPFDSEATVEYAVAARLSPPACDTGDIALPAPPEVARSAHPNQLIRFLPVLTALVAVGAMVVAYAARSSLARSPVFMVFPLMMLVSAAATVLSSADRRRGELDAQRADYFEQLASVRTITLTSAAAQRESGFWCNPDPDVLWTLVGNRRMWERSSGDSDFCRVRIGVGTAALARRLVVPAAEHRQDPVSAAALQRFVSVQSTVADIPVSVPLLPSASIGIRGDAEAARALVP